MSKYLFKIPFAHLLVTIGVLVVVGLTASISLSDWARDVLLDETGIIETATVIFYVLVSILIFFGPYEITNRKWLIGLICILFAARELDIHEKITEGDFLFFPKDFKQIYPSAYSAVEIVGIAFVVAIIIFMIATYSKVTARNLQERDSHQYMMIAGWMGVVMAIIIDGLGTKIFEATGYAIPDWANLTLVSVEETVELMIPVCFLFGLLQYYKTRIFLPQKI